ncbi:Tex family protein [Marinospirillum sp.]|uniref:Tex family protein n=1 Tax=Marinospirillum sp. TaxID=2183934 RepID=UPI003A8673CC
MLPSIAVRIAQELEVQERQVQASIQLLDEGSSVPFISRYRKEVTGGLDDTQLRHLEERLGYLRELEERRKGVLASIAEQDKLSPELEAQIQAAETKQRLEDLYLPYKPKRRTKAQIAREAGIEPLADALLAQPELQPEQEAQAYINSEAGFADVKAVLDGAKQILMERFSEEAELAGRLRQTLWEEGVLSSRVLPGQEEAGAKFSDYFAHDEPLRTTPSHRALAMFRGRNEGYLALNLRLPDEEEQLAHPFEAVIAEHWSIRQQQRPADRWLHEVVRWTWKIKLSSRLETELLGRLRELAEEAAIQVFAHNLKDLLLAAPAGPRPTLALDPGLRTGVKVAVVDATGKLVDHTTIYPHAPRNQWQESIAVLARLCAQHQVELIAVGNGTASRETDQLAAEVISWCHKQAPEHRLQKVMVNEAGASIYSASALAAKEFPDLDATHRSAVSIGRRLQDPLAELVKIEPKSIGVGQYQHDVSQIQLAKTLDAVIEDCVNAVGVDLNTASVPLLARTSGLNATLAENIVAWRDEQGAFRTRQDLLKVKRLGPKAYEQCAGFLRIMRGQNPLDASAVHPEAYPLVERIAQNHQRPVESLIGDTAFLTSLNPTQLTDAQFGLPTVKDILKELDKPGRDPRPEFRAAVFMEGVEDIKDLKPGMVLEGVVTNVANFGAFVDIGVHQDGLVHISALADRFIQDPREVVKAGDLVKVKVLEVDIPRKRIALTRRLDEQPVVKESSSSRDARPKKAPAQPALQGNTLGALLLAAQKKKK